ncbi:MAG TPA: HIT family protein [Firmicutes bacterium]|nr:HIT family protein [Bacillota bacterium]
MCLTCQIVQGKIRPPGGLVYINDVAVLHHSIDTDIPGYLILSPVRHVESFSDLNVKEMRVLCQLLKSSLTILEKAEGIKKVYICSFGEVSTHFHFHIFPRYDWMLSLGDTQTNEMTDAARIFSKVRQLRKHNQLTDCGQGINDLAEKISNSLILWEGENGESSCF